jgi:glycosyltransferase involved in cell wall biosynthesis
MALPLLNGGRIADRQRRQRPSLAVLCCVVGFFYALGRVKREWLHSVPGDPVMQHGPTASAAAPPPPPLEQVESRPQADNPSITASFSNAVPANDEASAKVDELPTSLHSVHVPQAADSYQEAIALAAPAIRYDEQRLMQINDYLQQHGQSLIALSDVDNELLVHRLKPVGPPQPVVDVPLVSVIIPAWNAEARVRGAALSIIQQTWTSIELIIVDDASTDGTWQVLLEIAAEYKNVKLMRNVANVGPYVSKNMALLKARGKYVTGQDSDDWAHPQRIELQMRPILKSFGLVRATIADAVRLKNDLTILNHPVVERDQEYRMSSPDGISQTALTTLLIDRQWMLENLGSWDAIAFGADGEILHRIGTMVGFEGLKVVHAIGIFYMDRENSLSSIGGGYNSPMSPRLIYRSAWAEWHEKVQQSGNAYLPFPPANERLFSVPDVAVIDRDKICENMSNYGFSC